MNHAEEHVPPVPGLYAIHGSIDVWAQLGLDVQDGMPLYIGKSEGSLVERELRTHFASDPLRSPRTGSSTVRRSFAALLRESLRLTAVPRNRANPGYYCNYGLEDDGDDRLTAWMHENLLIAVWPAPAGMSMEVLRDVEKALLREWPPPINIQHVEKPLERLKAGRTVMKLEAEQWAIDRLS